MTPREHAILEYMSSQIRRNGYPPAIREVCEALNQNILDQVLEAQDRGEYQVTVHVPYCGSEDNWPHSTYMGGRVAASLYKHGITSRLMEIEILPDPQMNAELHVLEELVP